MTDKLNNYFYELTLNYSKNLNKIQNEKQHFI